MIVPICWVILYLSDSGEFQVSELNDAANDRASASETILMWLSKFMW